MNAVSTLLELLEEGNLLSFIHTDAEMMLWKSIDTKYKFMPWRDRPRIVNVPSYDLKPYIDELLSSNKLQEVRIIKPTDAWQSIYN